METARSVIDSVTTVAVNGTLPENLRVTLLEAATKLVAALQKPEDAITKLAYQVLQLNGLRNALTDHRDASHRSSWQLELCSSSVSSSISLRRGG
jgi:hypothetical protein